MSTTLSVIETLDKKNLLFKKIGDGHQFIFYRINPKDRVVLFRADTTKYVEIQQYIKQTNRNNNMDHINKTFSLSQKERWFLRKGI